VAIRATPLPPAERRAAILHAVSPALIEHGEGVTTKRLAEIAGVSEGTIFNVFDDKDDLIDAVVDAVLDPEPLEIALARIDPAQPFEARLIAATELVQQRMIEIWRLFAALGARGHRHPRELPQSPGLTAIFASEPHRVRAAPADAARRLRAMTVTLTHPLMAPEPATPAEIVDAFLHGVATRPEAGP
jgi:AcrR family transcriptional regulator